MARPNRSKAHRGVSPVAAVADEGSQYVRAFRSRELRERIRRNRWQANQELAAMNTWARAGFVTWES